MSERIIIREERNDTIQFHDAYEGEHPAAKQWVATFPKHRSDEADFFAQLMNARPGVRVEDKR